MPELPQLSEVDVAIQSLCGHLQAPATCQVSILEAAGRVLAEPLLADRDSPALDVSAMDGFAVRWQDVASLSSVPVSGVTAAGSSIQQLTPYSAMRIFTGAPVPMGADTVIRREDCHDCSQPPTSIKINGRFQPGQHIRRRGENSTRGQEILPAGTLLDSVAMAAAASFAPTTLSVFDRPRIAIINTGDELISPGQPVKDWQVRDSNGPLLEAWLRSNSWLDVVQRIQARDTLPAVVDALTACLAVADAVFLTGGVSMGDTDHVPDAVQSLGAEVAFHRLPIRPGKPIFGAHKGGKLILGLPGNPVSVAVTSRVFGEPLLRTLAGIKPSNAPKPRVELVPDGKSIPLTWYRLVQIEDDGRAHVCPSRGSGDMVSLSLSHGFICIPPSTSGGGPWSFWSWH